MTGRFTYPPEIFNTRSAERLVPTILEWTNPKSIIDIGCGLATWLKVAAAHGVNDVIGVDVRYPEGCLIPKERFWECDLSLPLRRDRTFDLAFCLEVAEHLPASAADRFVDDLCYLAPTIVFSAAIPGQEGLGHLNEQWPQYWVEKFATHGFQAADCLRPRFWEDGLVEWWYRQNMLVFSRDPELWHRLGPGAAQRPLALVHPACHEALVSQLNSAWARIDALQGELLELGKIRYILRPILRQARRLRELLGGRKTAPTEIPCDTFSKRVGP